MKEIALIAPYENMYQLSRGIVKKTKYENVEILRGDLQEGVRAAHQAVENGVKVLVSRGGTFTRIKEATHVPVVEIQISAYDVLTNLRGVLLNESDRSLAIVGHDNLIYGYDLIKQLMKRVRRVTIAPGDSVEETIDQCVKEGVDVFVGDAVVNRVCHKRGLACHMAESGEDSIRNAIEEAQRILQASKREAERAKRYMTLVDYVHDGVIATDDQNRILLFNTGAQKILNVSREDCIGNGVSELIQKNPALYEMAVGVPVIDEVRTLNGTQVTISSVPIEVDGEQKGSVAVFQDITSLQNLEKKVRVKLAKKGFIAKHSFQSIICASREMERCLVVAKRFSRFDSSVLIEGDSGVGKELFAQSIHNESRRKSGPFVAVNCAALPQSLVESELFGYVEGAFTGSRKGGKAGYFELAHGGTIFLDEISELPLDLQGRLLRVIQEREVMRVGDDKVIPLDVRVVCATNRSLKEMVRLGRFRRDLLYRINALSFYIPPLSQRKEDVPLLAEHFLMRFARKYSKEILGFSQKASDYLMNFNYEGNVRELQGMIERAVILCDGDTIKRKDFEGVSREDAADAAERTGEGAELSEQCGNAASNSENMEDLLGENPTLAELERAYIKKIYHETGKSALKTSRILGIDRSTLWRKMKQWDEAW